MLLPSYLVPSLRRGVPLWVSLGCVAKMDDVNRRWLWSWLCRTLFHVLDAAGCGEILTVGLRLLERWEVKGCHKRGLLRINGLRYRTNTCTPFPGLLQLLPFLDPSVIDPLAGAQLKRDEFLPDRINSDFILQTEISFTIRYGRKMSEIKVIFA